MYSKAMENFWDKGIFGSLENKPLLLTFSIWPKFSDQLGKNKNKKQKPKNKHLALPVFLHSFPRSKFASNASSILSIL
jgi:hypothetical protein